MTLYQPRNFTLTDYRFAGDEALDIPPYLFSEPAVIAIDVALATRRPLLVAGPPGCGKSRLAEAMAALLGWNFLATTMTSHTRLEELTVEVDHLRRLHDAHCAAIPAPAPDPDKPPLPAAALKPDAAYYTPGIFWWAFDRRSASRRNLPPDVAAAYLIGLDFPGRERAQPNGDENAVLLIDEIDKAEPDLPNDLLEPLDRRSVRLPDGRTLSAAAGQELLTVITTNRERELPKAFVRRCVTLVLGEPDADGLTAIAQAHQPQAEPARIRAIAKRIIEFRDKADKHGLRPPGTSEFLDAVRTCETLQISVDGGDLWRQIEDAVLFTPTI